MTIRVFDMNGVERDFEYAKSKYGVAFRRAEVEPGQKVYRLIELWEKSGPASLVTQVLGEDGSPMANVDVALYWPDAPDPPEPPTPVYAHDWYRNFVHGLTNVNGDVGPGMGTGAYHGIGEGGPHAVWVRDPDIPSDICEKLGMLAGTPHDHLDQKFKLMIAGQEPRELPDPDDFEIVARLEEEYEAATLGIAYPASVAYDTRGRAGIEGTDEDLETDGPVAFQYDSKDYALVTVCADFHGESSRRFWIEAHDYQSGKTITPRVTEEFAPKPDLRRVIYVVDFKAEEPPPKPEPEWTMTITRKPGLNLLTGSLPEAGITVSLIDPGGHVATTTSGSKKEHGEGGFEFVLWHWGVHTIQFLDQAFEIEAMGDTIYALFEKTGEAPLEVRLVSSRIPRGDAEELLEELEDKGFAGIFSIEEES